MPQTPTLRKNSQPGCQHVCNSILKTDTFEDNASTIPFPILVMILKAHFMT